jgi:hypothetical protein
MGATKGTVPVVVSRTCVQAIGCPLAVGKWDQDEDFPVFPVGSKPKRVLICPLGTTEPYLIPGRAYLLKIAEGWRANQLWSEFIAYRIASLVGLEAPPCFIAVDEIQGLVGNLIEFFYAYPDEGEPARFVPAAEYLRSVRGTVRTDRPHGVRTNLRICRALGITDAVQWWGRLLTFDALIGNTDRHPENWGFLFMRRGREASTPTLAPIFDNGTSLGYEQTDTKLDKAFDPAWLKSYIDKGRHHCGWDLADDRQGFHLELCSRYLSAYPDASSAMRNVIQFNPLELGNIIDHCSAFKIGIPFSNRRVDFVSALLDARRLRLLAALEG